MAIEMLLLLSLPIARAKFESAPCKAINLGTKIV